jgi:O-antigen/teichoic acid export membrane protein
MLGFGTVANKYFPYFQTKEGSHHNGFLFLILGVPLIGFIITSVLFVYFHDYLFTGPNENSALLDKYYLLILPLTFFTINTIVLEVYIRAFLKISFSNLVKEIILRLLTTLIILLYALDIININLFWYLFTASYGICMLLLIGYTIKIGQFNIKPNFLFLKKGLFREVIIFGVFGLFTALAGIIVSKIDIVMITYYLDLTDLGIFSLALYITTIIETPKKSITQIVNPIIASAWKNNNLKAIEDIYKKSSLNQLILGVFIFLLIWLNIESIFNLIPKGSIFIHGKYVILYMGLAKLADMATGVNGEIIGYSSKYKFGFFSILFLVVTAICMNYFLIPVYGITGAALATMFSIILFNLIKLIFIQIHYKLQPFTFASLYVIVIAGITWLIIAFIPDLKSDFFNLAYKSILITILFPGVIIYLKLSPDINELLNKNFNRFFKRKTD